ncbi:MAG: sugar phosphate nucleotidyltransferase, partial [Candidatus Caldarchaeum sp.]
LLVYYGDILTNLNLGELARKHVQDKAAATLALSPNYQLPVGVADVVDGLVKEMREKPFIPINVTIGILVLEARHLQQSEGLTDIMSDLIPRLIKQGEKVSAYVSDCFWYDVGSTEKYEKLSNELVDAYLEGLRQRRKS